MYRGFNISNIGFNGNEKKLATEYDTKHPNYFKSKVLKSIDTFIKAESTFDGNALINQWFPKIQKYDIFISHSHDDLNLAKALANWLGNSFGLSCFIDSTVWGEFPDLRKQINSYFSIHLGSKYTFNMQDRVSQHVMMMLNSSLMEMMSRCQCLFFLNTPNSVSIDEVLRGATYSPWIFSEIGMFNCIEKKVPPSLLKENQQEQENFANITYKLDLSQLCDLDANSLVKWQQQCDILNKKTKQICLNKLYELNPLDDGNLMGK